MVEGRDQVNFLSIGHAMEHPTGNPPRGLQFVLNTLVNEMISDTITMANLGYLQLKANPGVFDMVIRPGRGRELYQFDSLTDENHRIAPLIEDYGAKVVVNSFSGATIYPVLSKMEGKEHELLIEAHDSDQKEGFWDHVKSRYLFYLMYSEFLVLQKLKEIKQSMYFLLPLVISMNDSSQL